MASVGNLFVRMGLKANEFYSGMAKVSKSVLTQERQLLNLRRVAIAAFTGWGIKQLADEFLEAATTAEGYQVRLTGLLGSTQKGSQLFKEMNKYAAETPFEFEKIMSAATQLAGVMKGGVDEITKWMPMIGDLAAASGLTIEQTTQQVVRMYSAGAGAADLFRERGVLAMMGFQAGVSYTTEETKQKMLEAWAAPESKFRGMTDKLKDTWSGTMSMFSDHWFQFRNAVMQSGPFQAMKHQAQLLLKQLNKLKTEGKLDEWALKSAKVIVEGFGIATYAVQTFWNAFKWGEFVIAVLTKIFADFFINILGPFAFLSDTITNWVDELEHASNAADMWASDTATSIDETRNFFDDLRAKIEEIGQAHTAVKDTIIANQDEINESAALAHQDTFDKLGERTTWWELDSRARVMAEQKALLDISRAQQQQHEREKNMKRQKLRENAQYFKEIAQAMGEHGKWAFRAYQALAIAETTMSTYEAAQDAYKWGWKYGGPAAPVLSVVMAAVAVAAGMARIAQIASEKYEYAMGGWLASHPQGGWINQGSGASDDVYLGGRNYGMSGEYVVRKEAAAENAALLEAINRGETVGSGAIIPITLELDGEVLYSALYKASRDGYLQIYNDAIVAR